MNFHAILRLSFHAILRINLSHHQVKIGGTCSSVNSCNSHYVSNVFLTQILFDLDFAADVFTSWLMFAIVVVVFGGHWRWRQTGRERRKWGVTRLCVYTCVCGCVRTCVDAGEKEVGQSEICNALLNNVVYHCNVSCKALWASHMYWAVQAGLLTPLTFHLSALAAFTSSTYFLHNGRR